MLDAENHGLLEPIDINCSEVIQMGGRVKRGIIAKGELEGDVEVRVSMRSTKFLGSTELFTLRNLEPADYHLILVAIPRKTGSS